MLRSFVAVAEDLHFTRAAERLHIAQPALSQQIRQLERDLGVQLLQRSKRTVRLTEAGRVFLEHARKTLDDATTAKHAAQRAARGEVGRLSVGFVPAARDIVPAAVRAYRARAPAVEVVVRELHSRAQIDDLLNERIDLGLVHDAFSARGIEVEVLRHERFVVALPTDHPLAKRRRVALGDLRHERFITGSPVSADPVSMNRVVLAACATAGFEPKVSRRAGDLATRLVLVAAGFGVLLVLDRARPLASRDVVFRPLLGPPLGLDLLVAWRRAADGPTSAGFRETLRDAADASRVDST